ncbi:hypothetical protein VSX64_17640 [Aurantimonas sp. C2-6-R+9]|nr:hypothetical protein [Aurantimonas sp. C2-6-R+9]
MRLHRIERLARDQRRNGHHDHFAGRFDLLGLGSLIELMLADIGLAGQDAVKLADAPAPAVTGEDAALVEVVDDGLHAHRPRRAVAFKGKPVNQPHRVGVQRIDLQLLLDLGPALLGRDDAVADGRQGAVPEALPCILLQGAQDVLGVLL